ncbi:MAG: hypothetical protein GX421_09405 [Caldisericales bacterium]|nr:hypothetical protein [Caldisericales bacterium]
MKRRAILTLVSMMITVFFPVEITKAAASSTELPFTDDFNDGLAAEWNIVSGIPVILDGRLGVASDDMAIELNNFNLDNYTLEMDVWGEETDYCGFGYFKYLMVGFSPKLRFKFSYTDYSGDLTWEAYTSDEWKKINRYDDLDCGRFKIVVSGSSYRIFIKGELVSEIILTPAEGPLTIYLDDGVTVDNLSIK